MDNLTLKKPIENIDKLESSDAELSSSDGFINRLEKCADLAGSMNALARLSGMSQSGMRRYFIGGEPTRPVLVAIAHAVNVSLYWLATGKGEMLLDKPSKPQVSDSDPTDMQSEDRDDFAMVPLYDVEASAGQGAVVGEETQLCQLAFRKDWLINRGLQKDRLVTIKTKGDSMEPTLHDGDLLLVDTRIEKILDDSIYIIQDDHHLIVKRVQRALGGALAIISDNPRYKEQHLTPEQAESLKITGRVCWYGHEI